MNCHNNDKHKEFEAKLEKTRKKKLEAEELKVKEDSLQVSAAWEFLGGNVSQLWLLDEEQLIDQAKKKGLSTAGDKDDLIERIMGSHGHQQKDLDVVVRKPLLQDARTPTSKRRKNGQSKSKLSIMESPIVDLPQSPSSKSVVVSEVKRPSVDTTTLPGNLHSLNAAQLRSLCIAHGLKKYIPPGATKGDLLDIIEDNMLH
jgi:hypothetical protein